MSNIKVKLKLTRQKMDALLTYFKNMPHYGEVEFKGKPRFVIFRYVAIGVLNKIHIRSLHMGAKTTMQLKDGEAAALYIMLNIYEPYDPLQKATIIQVIDQIDRVYNFSNQ